MNRCILAITAASLTLAMAGGASASPGHVLSIKVAIDTYLDPVKFTLDRKSSCKFQFNGSDEAACVFATDCSKLQGVRCVQAYIRPGKHLMKADFGSFSISKWVFVGAAGGGKPKDMPECDVYESMGTAAIHMDCEQ